MLGGWVPFIFLSRRLEWGVRASLGCYCDVCCDVNPSWPASSYGAASGQSGLDCSRFRSLGGPGRSPLREAGNRRSSGCTGQIWDGFILTTPGDMRRPSRDPQPSAFAAVAACSPAHPISAATGPAPPLFKSLFSSLSLKQLCTVGRVPAPGPQRPGH